MFPFVLVAILLEWLVLWLQRKPLPQLGESAVSVTLIVNMEIFRYQILIDLIILCITGTTSLATITRLIVLHVT